MIILVKIFVPVRRWAMEPPKCARSRSRILDREQVRWAEFDKTCCFIAKNVNTVLNMQVTLNVDFLSKPSKPNDQAGVSGEKFDSSREDY